MRAEQMAARAERARRWVEELSAREAQLEREGLYEEALEVHRLILDERASLRYWRECALSGRMH